MNMMERITKFGLSVAAAAVLAIMVIETANVIATQFGRPIAGAFELIEALMVLVIFMALPEVQRRSQHITVDLVLQRLSAGIRKSASSMSAVLTLVFFGGMAWQGWKLFWESWLIREYAPGLIAFPIYPSKAFYALGLTATTLVILAKLMHVATKRRSQAGGILDEQSRG
jgi:TRAP-type C4-dicarboxylate transport system permease small subunit